MGTRNLTMVIHQGKTRIAQYGQFDGYVEGQGSTVLEFLKRLKKNKTMESFKKHLLKIKFIDENKEKEIDAFLESIGCKNGWLDGKQAEKYHQKYPLLSRDNGAVVLELVHKEKNPDKLWLHDQTNFAADSLFCEYAYVIDFDKNTLEVYRGFVKSPLGKKQRFYYLSKQTETQREGRDMYYPIRLAASFSLTKLPSLAKMILEVEGKESYESYVKDKKERKAKGKE
jgi:hypothetical protein